MNVLLSEECINEIYNKHVRINYTDDYVNKYVPLPLYLNNKAWKWENKDFPRIISLLEFKEYMLECNRLFDNVLLFNGDNDPELEYLKYNNLHNYNYADDANYDLHCLKLEKTDFDFAMLNQTIEHLYNPILALQNIHKHMKVGGVFYTNVPSNNIPHSTPYHFYTGITPVGLGAMVKLAGFNILKIGQWGNKEYLRQLYVTAQWPDYTYNSNPGHNEIECPIITWCLATKS